MMCHLISKICAVGAICLLSCLLLAFSFGPVLAKKNNSTAVNNSGNNRVHYPANVPECIEELKRTWPSKGDILDEFKSRPVKIANDYHFTLGMWIRNNWIHLGDGVLMDYFEKMGIYHPDDMSSIILVSLWRDLHFLPINLQEQVDEYKKLNSYNAPTVRERLLVPDDIWDKPLSLNGDNNIKLSDLKGKVIVLLLFANDIISPSAVSGLSALQDKFSKENVAFIGLHDGPFKPKYELSYIGNKSTTFPLIANESEFIWRIQDALISGTLEFPEVILIGKDGNMIVRFNEWNGDAASQKELCDEIRSASAFKH